jgi:acetylornithine deacetylase/succinyl-diaminopimelate desuccinylase-like protein
MRSAFRPLVVAVLLATAVEQPRAQTAALTPVQQLARDIYKDVIEFNSVNIGGGTTDVANALAKRFRDAGFPEQDIFLGGVQPNKHNLVVRYHGTGGANGPKPLVLLAHLDVVEALKSDWSPGLDPFKFLEKDGYFYGRGIIDDKAQVAIFSALVLQMKKERAAPDRDIVLALTADEEGGCCNGARWLFSNHRDLVDASFVLNEGAFGFIRNGKPVANTIEATQKVVGGFTVTAKNRGGHSSLPRPDNAIYELAFALTRLSAYKFPVQFNDVSRAYFEQTAKIESPEIAAAMRALIKDPTDAKAEAVLAADPLYNSMLRTTCVATMLKGGHASNALPQTAEATINCRMLPDARAADVRAGIVKALADTALEASNASNREPRAAAAVVPDMLRAVEGVTKEMWGDIPVIQIMQGGATDAIPWRNAGIPAYGISGLMIDPDDLRLHGRDERVRVKSFYDAQEFTARLVKRLTMQRAVP